MPSFDEVCEAAGALQTPDGGWYFSAGKDASASLKQLGHDLPEIDRPVTMILRAGAIRCTTDRDGREHIEGWAPQGRKLHRFFKHQEGENVSYDDIVRRVITPTCENAGFAIKTDRGWIWGNQSEAMAVLTSRLGPAGRTALANGIVHPWTRDNQPFAEEFLPGRVWNSDGARLNFRPTTGGSTPHWDRIFSHLGRGLDEAVGDCKFCAEHGISSGAKYLELWVARLFQKPTHRLPIMFFYSDEQNTGKSTLHRSLSLLMSKGCVDASNAITQGFNGELCGAILCYIDEVNLGRNSKAYETFKRWSDSPVLPIRQMRTDQFNSPNYTHWIHTANDLSFCPIEDGDQRIVVVEVQPLNDPIPWSRLEEQLIAEAPDFLGNILAMPLPPPEGRLFLPVLQTSAKKAALDTKKEESQAALRMLEDALAPWCGMAVQVSELLHELPPGIVDNAVALGCRLKKLGHEKVGTGEWRLRCSTPRDVSTPGAEG